MHDDGGVKRSDSQVKAVTAHSDGESDTTQGWLPLQLPGCLQVMVLAGIGVQHDLNLHTHNSFSNGTACPTPSTQNILEIQAFVTVDSSMIQTACMAALRQPQCPRIELSAAGAHKQVMQRCQVNAYQPTTK